MLTNLSLYLLIPTFFVAKLNSVFWKSEEFSITLGSWFYDSNKLTPCSTALALEIESLYQSIQPWTSSYYAELKSSISVGAEGEEKLKCDLKSLEGSYLIFIGPFLARVYSKDLSGRIKKTFFTAISGEHGGGMLLVRGFDNTLRLLKSRDSTTSSSISSHSPSSSKHERTSSTSFSSSNLNDKLTKRLSAHLGRSVRDPSGSNVSISSNDSDGNRSGTTTPTRSSREGAESPLPKGAAQPQSNKKPRSSSSGSLPTPNSSTSSSDLFKTLTSRIGYWGLGASASEDHEEARSKPDATAASIAKEASDSQTEPSDLDEENGSRIQEQSEGKKSPSFDSETEEEEFVRESEEEDRPVEVVLVYHGIGQRLATMSGWKSLDFTIAVNAFRLLVQSRANLNSPNEIGGEGFPGLLDGKRVQFLPVMWRSTLEDFKPTNDQDDEDEGGEGYTKNEFELDDILGESDSIPLVRQLISGVALDIPLYLSQHKPHILSRVVRESNRLHRLFIQRNPKFKENGGKVSILSHSLGAALSIDILSNQPTRVDRPFGKTDGFGDKQLEFDTNVLILIGSPVALFLWLNKEALVARKGREAGDGNSKEGISLDQVGKYGCLAVNRVANVFFTSDPIATRLNSTVSSSLAKHLDLKALDVKKAVHAVLRCLPGANQEGTNSSSGSRLFGWNKSTSTKGGNSEEGEEEEDGMGFDGAEGLFGKEDLETPTEEVKEKEEKKDKSWVPKLTSRKGKYADRPSSASVAEDKKLKKEWEEVVKPEEKEGSQEREIEEKVERSKTPQDSKKVKAGVEEKRKAYDRSEEKVRAQSKFNALNPLVSVFGFSISRSAHFGKRGSPLTTFLSFSIEQGVIDFSIPVSSSYLSHPYLEMLYSHGNYWNDASFADFTLAMLFASDEQLAKARQNGKGWK